MLSILIAFALLSLILVISNYIVSKINVNSELKRKTFHLSAGLSTASLVLFIDLKSISVVASIMFALMLIVRHKKLLGGLYQIKRKTYGEILFPIGVLFAAILAGSGAEFAWAVLILAISDSLASILGNKWPKPRLVALNKKSLAGTVAFFISTLAISLVFGYGILASILFGAILAATEYVMSNGLDNLFIPVVAIIINGYIA